MLQMCNFLLNSYQLHRSQGKRYTPIVDSPMIYQICSPILYDPMYLQYRWLLATSFFPRVTFPSLLLDPIDKCMVHRILNWLQNLTHWISWRSDLSRGYNSAFRWNFHVYRPEDIHSILHSMKAPVIHMLFNVKNRCFLSGFFIALYIYLILVYSS